METTVRVEPWVERVAAILLRKDRNWAWLARQIGIHRQLLSQSTLGRRPLKAGEQERIAHVLEVPEGLLFWDDAVDSRPSQ